MSHPEQAKEVVRKYQEADPDKTKLIKKKARKRQDEIHPRRASARLKITNAIAQKKIVRQPCAICNAERAQAHHCDYSKPYDVTWLCHEHHIAWHRIFIAED